MDKFDISVVGERLTVAANEDGSFTVLKEEKILGELTPYLVDSEPTVWTSNEFTKDEAMQIGELIEEHYL
jgi:hypothetical protein